MSMEKICIPEGHSWMPVFHLSSLLTQGIPFNYSLSASFIWCDSHDGTGVVSTCNQWLRNVLSCYHHVYPFKCDAGYIPLPRQIILAQQRKCHPLCLQGQSCSTDLIF